MAIRQADMKHRDKQRRSRIRHARNLAGLSTRDVADQMGVHFTYIATLENGTKAFVTVDVLEQVAAVLADTGELAGLSADDVLDYFLLRTEWKRSGLEVVSASDSVDPKGGYVTVSMTPRPVSAHPIAV